MNSKRRAAPSPSLVPPWIIIATVILHAKSVMTWTMLPTSISRRHQPQPQRSNDLFKSIESPAARWSLARLFRRDHVVDSPLFMVANEDESLLSDESDDDESDEDSIMEIANALTSSKSPSLDTTNDEKPELSEVDNYLDKASEAWEGAAAAPKPDELNKLKINKTRLTGSAARESFLSGGIKPQKGSAFTKSKFPAIKIGSDFKAAPLKGTSFPQPLARGPLDGTKIGSLKSDTSIALKGIAPKQFPPASKESDGNAFPSFPKLQKVGVVPGEKKQVSPFLKFINKSPGSVDGQRSDDTKSTSSSTIGVGAPLVVNSPLKGSIPMEEQPADTDKDESKGLPGPQAPVSWKGEESSKEPSPINKQSSGSAFPPFPKMQKGSDGPGEKKASQFMKFINKAPGSVEKTKSADNEGASDSPKIGIGSPPGLKGPLKGSIPTNKQTTDEVNGDSSKVSMKGDASKELLPISKQSVGYVFPPFPKVQKGADGSGEQAAGPFAKFINKSPGSAEKAKSDSDASVSSSSSRTSKIGIGFPPSLKGPLKGSIPTPELSAKADNDDSKSVGTPSKGDASKKSTLLGAKSEGNSFLSGLKLPKGAAGLGEKKQFVGAFLKFVKDPGGSKIGVGFSSGVKSSLKGSIPVGQQSPGAISKEGDSADSQPVTPLKGVASKELSPPSKLQDDNSFLSSLKIPKGAAALGEKKQFVGSFLKSIKSTDGTIPKIGTGFPPSLKIPLNGSISLDKQSTAEDDSPLTPKDKSTAESEQPSSKSSPSDAKVDALTSDSTVVNTVTSSSVATDNAKINGESKTTIDFEEENNARKEQDKWIAEQNRLAEERRIKRLEAVSGDISKVAIDSSKVDDSKVVIDFEEESKAREEQEKWIAEQNQLAEERRIKRLQESNVAGQDKDGEQVLIPDTDNTLLKGDASKETPSTPPISKQPDGNTFLSSLKAPKGSLVMGEKKQFAGAFLKSIKAPVQNGTLGGKKSVIDTSTNFIGTSKIGVGTPLKGSGFLDKQSSEDAKNDPSAVETSSEPATEKVKVDGTPFFVSVSNGNEPKAESSLSDDKPKASNVAIDFDEETKLLEEQKQWIAEQNRMVEERRVKRIQEASAAVQQKDTEQVTPKTDVKQTSSISDEDSKFDTSNEVKMSVEREVSESNQKVVPKQDDTDKDENEEKLSDNTSTFTTGLKGAVKSFDIDPAKSKLGGAPPVGLKGVEAKKGGLPFPPLGMKGAVKSFGMDPSKSTLGGATPVPLKGLEAKKGGLPFPSPGVKAVVKFGPGMSKAKIGMSPPTLPVKGTETSEESSSEDDSSSSPAEAVDMASLLVPKGIESKQSSTEEEGAAPLTGLKGAVKSFFGIDPAKSNLGGAPPVGLKGFEAKKGGLPFPPLGMKGAVKSFGMDPSKSKLGGATPVPLKGLEAKKGGLPFPSPGVKAAVKFGPDITKAKIGMSPPTLPVKGTETSEESNLDMDDSEYKQSPSNDFEDAPAMTVAKNDGDFDDEIPESSSHNNDLQTNDSSGTPFSATDRVPKEIGTGAPFEPKAFSPPKTRADPIDPSIIDVAFESSPEDDYDTMFEKQVRESKTRPPSQPNRPLNLWGGESFKGTVSSRSYGVGPSRPLGSPESKPSSDLPRNHDNIVESRQNESMKQEKDKAVSTSESGTKDSSFTLASDEVKQGDAKSRADIDRRIQVLEEQNCLLDEKLKAQLSEASKIEEDRRKVEKQSYSEQIKLLTDHISRLEKEVNDSASKSERAIRSREDEIKKMAEVIQTKTKSQLALEANMLREIDIIRLSAEKQSRQDMESLKNRLLEYAKSELSEIKSLHDKKIDDITWQLKMKDEQTKEMSKINQLQSELLSELKAQVAQLQQNESYRKSKEAETKNKETATSDNRYEQTQLKVEEVMENIQNIEPLHNVVLASDVPAEQGSTDKNTTSPINGLPKYETLSRGARIPTTTSKIPVDEKPPQASATGGALAEASITDALAADVESLELISFCQAEFDSESPSVYDPIEALRECVLPSDYPFVSILRDSSPYIVNHRHSTIVYHIPGDLISDSQRFFSVMDDIALTWLFGMKIVISVGCRRQIVQRLERLHGTANSVKMPGVRITSPETLRILEEEAGFCRFEVERLLNRCLRNKGADCNVVSGCFITAKKFGVVDGVDYQLTGYPTKLQVDKINRLHSRNDVVLLTPLGFTKDGDALNVHSEALAAFTASALKASKVVYFSSHPMVLRGRGSRSNGTERIQMIRRSNANEILSHYGLHINCAGFPSWKHDIKGNAINRAQGLSYDQQSMLLKMGWATHAIEKGVERAHIIDCEDGSLLDELFTARRGYGTCISQDDYEAPHPEDWNDDLTAADGVESSMIEW